MSAKTIIKGTLIFTISGILCRIMGFIFRIYISRIMPASQIGLYQMVMPICVLCQAAAVGLVHCRNKIYSRIPCPEKERQRLRQFSGNLALLHRHICDNCHNYNQKFRIYLENISEQQSVRKPAYHCCVLYSFCMYPLCYFKLFYRT